MPKMKVVLLNEARMELLNSGLVSSVKNNPPASEAGGLFLVSGRVYIDGRAARGR